MIFQGHKKIVRLFVSCFNSHKTCYFPFTLHSTMEKVLKRGTESVPINLAGTSD